MSDPPAAAWAHRRVITPSINAISLGLVGRGAMSSRTGRNFRYAAAGHALTALSMGAAGTYFSPGAIFVTAACLCVPALVALSFIRPEEIDYARARNAAKVERGIRIDSVFTLAKNRSLLLFAGCVVHRSFRFWVRIWRGERAHPRF